MHMNYNMGVNGQTSQRNVNEDHSYDDDEDHYHH